MTMHLADSEPPTAFRTLCISGKNLNRWGLLVQASPIRGTFVVLMACTVNEPFVTGLTFQLDSLYSSFENHTRVVLEETLKKIDDVVVQYIQEDCPWMNVEKSCGKIQESVSSELQEATSQELHCQLGSNMRGSIECMYNGRSCLVRISHMFLGVASEFSMELLRAAMDLLSTMFIKQMTFLEDTLILEATKSSQEILKIRKTYPREPAVLDTRHCSSTKRSILDGIEQCWGEESNGVATVCAMVMALSEKRRTLLQEIHQMNTEIDSKAQLKQTLITEYDNVVKQLLLTNLEESEYQSNHACAVQKKSHLVQVTDQGNPACHRRRAFVQRTRQEQQHKDQLQQLIQHKVGALKALHERLTSSLSLIERENGRRPSDTSEGHSS